MKAEIPRLPIVSGGQTDGDRAGLNVGLALGLPVGGGCPQCRRAEDRVIPDATRPISGSLALLIAIIAPQFLVNFLIILIYTY